MKANKSIVDDIGGAFLISTKHSTASGRMAKPESNMEVEPESDALDNLYALPIEPIPAKRHDANATKNRIKAKRLSEARLVRLSQELSQLADEIRYLNPLMAETLDEAWEATEDAIEMLSNHNSGW